MKQNRATSTGTFQAFSRRVLHFIESCPAHRPGTDKAFNDLALELFELQFETVPVYRDFSRAQGAEPGRVSHWSGIPAVPARAFKEWELTSLPKGGRTRVFLSSGTTGQASRSRHYHCPESLDLYEASVVRWFGRHLVPGQDPNLGKKAGDPLRFVALTPPGSQAPESSLVHMLETVREAFDFAGTSFFGQAGPDGMWRLDLPELVYVLQASISEKRPVLVAGTAFSFVHLLDHLVESGVFLGLATGSRVMETGGYKGQSRVLRRSHLHALIRERLGIAPSHLVSEYGMSELSSQAYDRAAGLTLGDLHPGGVFQFPPWARVQVISPETGRETPEGELGLVRVFDLANVYSVVALQTEDLAARRGPKIELAGRAPQAEPRGCSLLAQEAAI